MVAFDIRTGERRWTRHYTGVDVTFARGDDAGRLGIVATQYGDDEVPVVDTVGSGDGERRTSARLPVVAEGPWLAAYVPA